MTDVAGTLREGLAGRYRVEREIGRGGMATVHLARDVRHDRNVAVKVLDPDLGAVLGAERFLSEIKVTANLQHPNLLPLFDSGAVDGLLYYVMPFIEGESLRHRLDREKQLPVSEAVQIAVGVAKALGYAHAQGVIHRDLKPENVLLQAGQPLVADFGIALAVSRAGGTRVTQTGLSLGTPQYMSPEQATGDRTIDARSDIYALGAVLYEMLTGEPPHTGPTVQAVIAKVLTDRPRAIRLARPGVPPHVEAAVEQALEKLPADRYSTADRFAEALEGRVPTVARPATRGARPATHWRQRALLLLPWVLTAATTGVLLTNDGPSAPDALVMRAVLPFGDLDQPAKFAISPDGQYLAFVADTGGVRHLFVRAMDDLTPRRVEGSAGAQGPFFSPDSRNLAFFANNRLKRVPVSGGAAQDLAAVPQQNYYSSGTWTVNDELVINSGGAFQRIPATGGSLTQISPDSGPHARGAWPLSSPDGQYVFFMRGGPAGEEDDLLSVLSVRTGKWEASDFPTRELAGVLLDHILFRRSDGALMAVRFDPGTGRITGQPVQVLETAVWFTVSRSGTAVYYADSGNRSLQLRAGDSTRTLMSTPWRSHTPRLSADGKFVAFGNREELWVHELAAGTTVRVAERGLEPEWSADGRHVLYVYVPPLGTQGPNEVRWRLRDGSEPHATLFSSDSLRIRTAHQAPDGSLYLGTATGIRRVAAGATTATLLVPDGIHPRVSPDGKWLAYVSSESGESQVYIRPITGTGSRLVVSEAGAEQPVWERNGKALLYQGRGGYMRATLDMAPSPRVVRRDVVLTGGISGARAPQFDATLDGQRLLVLSSSSESGRIVIVQNFIEELRARLARSNSAPR